MFTFVALSSLAAVASAKNVLKTGSMIDISLDVDSPPCPITVDITSAQANAECFVQFHAPRCGKNLEPGTCKANGVISYTFNKDTLASGETTALSYVDGDDEVAEAPCPAAGTYVLGAQLKSCTQCILGKNANLDISATVRNGDTFMVPMENDSSSGRIYLLEDQKVEFTYKAEANNVAHFNIDKCFGTCETDNYEYTAGPVGGELSDVSSKVTSGLVKITHDTAGDYRMVVTLKSKSTWFLAKFKLNEDPGSTDYPVEEVRCAESDCSKASLDNCGDCVDDVCNWCAAESKCTQDFTCASGAAALLNEDNCSSAASVILSAAAIVSSALVLLL